MYHTHAAQPCAVREANELPQRLACFVRAQAVQVQVALNAPVPAAQLACHVQANAGAAKAHLVIHVQQGADVKLIAHGFQQHALFIQLQLQGAGCGRLGLKLHTLLGGERCDRADIVRKQMAFPLGGGFGLLAGLFCGFAALALGLELLGDATQGMQALMAKRLAHSNPSSAMDRLRPCVTMM